MSKVRLSKGELARQRNQLQLYQRLLPSLDLKRQQLSAEYKKAQQELEQRRRLVDQLEGKIGEELPMLASREIDLSGLVRMTAFDLDEENVVGVRLPLLRAIACEVSSYSNLAKPAWVDVLVERLKQAAEERTRVLVAEERVRILNLQVRRVTQRVNLFERILIPEAKENIQRILIVLGDMERQSVARSKLTKAKQKHRSMEALSQ
jgi:V/A-type H+-transporting ATPase subunit D